MKKRLKATGTLVANPELAYSLRGTPVCNLALSSGRSARDDRASERWHLVVFRGPLALITGLALQQGDLIETEGFLLQEGFVLPANYIRADEPHGDPHVIMADKVRLLGEDDPACPLSPESSSRGGEHGAGAK